MANAMISLVVLMALIEAQGYVGADWGAVGALIYCGLLPGPLAKWASTPFARAPST